MTDRCRSPAIYVRALLSGKRDPCELFYFGTLQPCVCFTVTRLHTLQDLSDADQLYEAREQARTEKMNCLDSIFFLLKLIGLFSLCVICVRACGIVAFACRYAYPHMGRSRRRMLDVLPYDFLLYSLEMVSLTEPGVRLVAGQRAPVMPLSLLLQRAGVAAIHKDTCLL